MPGICSLDIVYAVGGVLFAVPFDLNREVVTGSSVPVIEGVRRGAFAGVESGVAQFSVSKTGSLVYTPTRTQVVSQRNLVIINRKGDLEPLRLPPSGMTFRAYPPMVNSWRLQSMMGEQRTSGFTRGRHRYLAN